jgi:hypothetical protein
VADEITAKLKRVAQMLGEGEGKAACAEGGNGVKV